MEATLLSWMYSAALCCNSTSALRRWFSACSIYQHIAHSLLYHHLPLCILRLQRHNWNLIIIIIILLSYYYHTIYSLIHNYIILLVSFKAVFSCSTDFINFIQALTTRWKQTVTVRVNIPVVFGIWLTHQLVTIIQSFHTLANHQIYSILPVTKNHINFQLQSETRQWTS